MTAVAPVPFAMRFPLFMRAALVAVWLVGAAGLYGGIRLAVTAGGVDSHAYWLTGQEPLSYTRLPGQLDAFLYSPLFADVIRPFTVLPWPVFGLLWFAAEVAVLVWLVRPLPVQWAVPVALLAVPELAIGNVYLFFAAAAVLGMRRPVWWLLPVLTKVVTGIGLVWFAATGQWRRLAAVLAVLAVLAAGSYLLQPDAWLAWLRLLSHPGETSDGLPIFAGRCVAGLVLVAVGARRGWVLLIPAAMVVVSPVYSIPTATMLLAVPRLMGAAPKPSRSTASPVSSPTSSRSTPSPVG